MSVLEQLTRERDQALREKAEALRQLNIADCAHAVTVHEWKQRASEAEARIGECYTRLQAAGFKEASTNLADVMSMLIYQYREAEAARDAARRDQCQADGELFDNRAHIETLREALRGALNLLEHTEECGQYSEGCDCDCGRRELESALATTPTTGLMEKVRALCAMAAAFLDQSIGPMRDGGDAGECGERKINLREALAALYTIAPGVKP